MKTTQRYACKALQGESGYNICVNSDMTVSCNCQDYFGNGQIGNLKEKSLNEIFDDAPARKLREDLFNGTIPIPECQGCPELVKIEEETSPDILENFTVPSKGLMVENTVICNLKCLSCNRVDLMKTRRGKSMSLDDLRIVSNTIRENKIEVVHFFNLGEPFLSKSVLEELKIIREGNEGVQIYTSTNGMFIDSEYKVEAALLMDHIYFSMDGSDQESTEKYQVGAVFQKSFDNIANLASVKRERGLSSPTIEWKYVVFPWNSDKKYIDKAVELAHSAGVDILSFFRGGGKNTYSPQQFTDLESLKGVGFVSWRGREINIGQLDRPVLDSLILKWRSNRSENHSDTKELEINIQACIENSEELDNSNFVKRSYRALLEREPDQGGLDLYSSHLDAKNLSRADFARILMESDEFSNLAS